MKKINNLVYPAITAALYVTLTLGFAPLSFGSVQFRFAELLNLLVFINPIYAYGVIAGCFISNLFSPLGIIDVVVGTLSTVFSVGMIALTAKNVNTALNRNIINLRLFVATLWPTVSSVFIGLELWYVFNIPFVLATLSVMIGQFVVVTCMGYPIFIIILRNKYLYSFLSQQ